MSESQVVVAISEADLGGDKIGFSKFDFVSALSMPSVNGNLATLR
jgi:hypothetical protein